MEDVQRDDAVERLWRARNGSDGRLSAGVGDVSLDQNNLTDICFVARANPITRKVRVVRRAVESVNCGGRSHVGAPGLPDPEVSPCRLVGSLSVQTYLEKPCDNDQRAGRVNLALIAREARSFL
jgi:hypothetical protein